MAAQSSIKVNPDTNELPDTISIVCSGLDNTKDVELLVNSVVRHTVSVDSEGDVNSTYTIPVGSIQDALVDFGSCSSSGNTGNILCSIKTSLDSMELRYA